MKLKHLMAAATLAAMSATAVPAYAGALGVADLALTSFLLRDSATNDVLTNSTIRIISESRTGTSNSNFNGVEGVGAGAGSKTSFVAGAEVDVAYRCAGPDCGAIAGVYGGTVENNTTTHLLAPSGNFAVGDMYIAGSAIGGGAGAQGLTRADTSVNQATNEGGANATILNSVTAALQFTVTSDVTAYFELGYNAFVNALITALAPNEVGFASGAISWSLALTDAADPGFALLWSPTEINRGFATQDVAGSQSYSGTGLVSSNSRTFQVGHTYSLTIIQASNSTARLIPEPGSMMLLGLGLFALVMTTRRRVK